MKKILILMLGVSIGSVILGAYADPCSDALGVNFTPNQRTIACKNFETQAISIPVLALTPVANVNFFQAGTSMVPTYAANSAGFVGRPTVVPGLNYRINNNGPNAIKVISPVGLNRPGLTPTPGQAVVVAANAYAVCNVTSSTNINCTVPALPTPQ